MTFQKLLYTLSITLLFSAPGFTQTDSASGEMLEKCGQFPENPAIPNGRNATEEDMVAAQKSIKTYMAEGNKYVECVDGMESVWGEGITEEQKAVIIIFHNKAIDEMQAVADLFNSAVRAYKGRK